MPDKPTIKRLRDVIVTTTRDRDAVLHSIENQDVLVQSMTSERRQGRFREYDLTTVTLADGQTFQVAGGAVARVVDLIPEAEFPITLRFLQRPSDFDPGATYWDVE